MKIAVMGAGAVGAYYGGRLAAAGQDVHFIARGAHLAAMREHGLKVLSERGDFHLDSVQATDDPVAIGPADVVMLCVKLWDTDAAIEAMAPLMGPDSVAVSFQNGVYAEDRLAAAFGRERVWGGTAQIPAVIEAPGVIRHTGTFAGLEFGELDNARTERIEAFRAACEAAGIQARVVADIDEAIWRKFILLTAMSAATSLCRSAIGPIRARSQGRALFRALLDEAAAVAHAKGIAIAADLEARLAEVMLELPADMKASMTHDLERGNRLELDYLSGAVVRLGAELGVDTPTHRTVAWALALYADGAPAAAG